MKKTTRYLLITLITLISCYILFYLYALIHRLELNEQRKNITIYDRYDNILFESNFKKNMEWLNIDDIPIFIQDAIISVEDKRFYWHAGFDPIRISKALLSNLNNQSISQGGSTITQQYAKNLFLTNEQTFSRKFAEMLYAARLEMQYSKSDILEGYINTLYYGHGIFGIKAASKFFFNKTLSELNIKEIAMLIGIPNGPSIYSPFINPEKSNERTNLILKVLLTNNCITSQQYKNAQKAPLLLAEQSNAKASGSEQYYIDAVLTDLKQLKIDLNQEIKVHTYYDPQVQQTLQAAIVEHVVAKEGLQVSAIIIEPFTSATRALIGGVDYAASQYNRATNSLRQVASTIKPLLYYNALQQGFTPSSQFTSQPTSFKVGNDQTYAPSNYNDTYNYQDISLINAISTSDNIFAVKTHLFLGCETLANTLSQFDIENVEPQPSLALGTLNTSIEKLANIYNTFASEGYYLPSATIESVNNKTKTIYKRNTSSKRLLERDEVLILNQLLTSTYDAKNLKTTFPTLMGSEPKTKVAVKSGTSDWDSLIIGFNPQYTIGVWSGFDDNRSLDKTYYSPSKNVFKTVFDNLYPNNIGPWYEMSPQLESRIVNPISGENDPNGSMYWYKKE